jgi:hypothetical protein
LKVHGIDGGYIFYLIGSGTSHANIEYRVVAIATAVPAGAPPNHAVEQGTLAARHLPCCPVKQGVLGHSTQFDAIQAKVSNATIQNTPWSRSLVERLDLLNLVIAAHEDARPVVDVLGHDFQHALHLAVDGLAAG